MMKAVGCPTTVGELRALIAKLPDDMPLHHRGDMGDHPPGVSLVIRQLAFHKDEPGYFGDIENDAVWSKPEYRHGFSKPFLCLCTI